MEKSIISKFKQLHVLPRFDFKNMDDLVQDLTNALEESSCTKIASSKSKKRRGFKRRSKKVSATATVSHDNVRLSEDSESSFDGAPTPKEPDDSTQQTDSDEMNSASYLSILSYIRRHTPYISGSFAESDSVNENFSPIQAHRRKRKFKRMAVDPSPCSFSPPNHLKYLLGKTTKNKCSAKILKHRSDIENMYRNLRMDPFGVMMCGKRKRSTRERSVEFVDSDGTTVIERSVYPLTAAGSVSSTKTDEHCFLEPLQRRETDDCHMDCCDERQVNMKQIGESSSSSLSSSESDAGVYTNDEGREGDDEQSDFYHESGPACGIPSIVPWWESESIEDSLTGTLDPKLHAIITGSFQHMSWHSQENFRERVRQYELNGREIRAGRRRLRDLRPSFSVITAFNEKISKFLQDPDQCELRLPTMKKKDRDQVNYVASLYSLNVRSEGMHKNKNLVLMKTKNTTQVVNVDHYAFQSSMQNRTVANDIKRRRKTPPSIPVTKTIVAEDVSPINTSNVGNQMLRRMGWKPGTSLGSDGKGIQVPVQAIMRPKLQGLGFEEH